MANLGYAQAAVSTAFRATAYLFLEVIPHSSAKYLLSILYVTYLVLYSFQPPALEQSPTTKDEPSNGEAKVPFPTDEKSVEEDSEDTKTESEDSKPLPPVPTSPEESSSLYTLLLSLPTPSRHLRLTNLFINTLLAVAALEFVTYPYFDDAADVVYTRIGAVYPDAAKIVVRYPGLAGFNQTNATVQIAWRQVPNSGAVESEAWKDGPVTLLSEELDWVNTVKVSGLWPSTTYEYVAPYPSSPIRFHTFPDPYLNSGVNFRFLASSCITPNFPYAPLQGRRIKGFDVLADYLWPKITPSKFTTLSPEPSPPTPPETEAPEKSASGTSALDAPEPTAAPVFSVNAQTVEAVSSKAPTEFMIFMGDFIYADVPIYYGDDKEAYRRLYRRNYQSPSFRKVYERLPFIHTYDDHEIINNYAGHSNDSAPPFANANDAFALYNAQGNYDSSHSGQHYYDFRYGDVAFFVMDTRRHRSIIEETDEPSRTMLGEQQLTALYDWLGKVNNTATFKFVVTSVPFTGLWTYEGVFETWNGFQYEKTSLLNAFHTVPNFAAVEFPSANPARTVYEISTSPLSMFYSQSEDVINRTKEV
ncbi:PhoD-like phosphatase-domain-containing protein [Fomitopsis serialis]|uniref:PhoD-like phosphatase-domain-containing protein n=1 Tax=Fomitopsis serialis TaxID=139415 RepID=UPI0020085B4F|nr:PhoD-like phosphatase-domain-containing protein [Neoantrodia serialis]KAH9914716.1 PhoD-like phosphatase-domain-containing protein [Neoantrodia serialis]